MVAITVANAQATLAQVNKAQDETMLQVFRK